MFKGYAQTLAKSAPVATGLRDNGPVTLLKLLLRTLRGLFVEVANLLTSL